MSKRAPATAVTAPTVRGSVDEWTRVADGLPVSGARVLVALDHERKVYQGTFRVFGVASFSIGAGDWNPEFKAPTFRAGLDWGGEAPFATVTHWRLLPAHPEETKP